MESSQFTVGLLTFLSVMGLGGAGVAALWARRMLLRDRLEGESSKFDIESNGLNATQTTMVDRVGTAFQPRKRSGKLEQQLAQAGYFSPTAAGIYLGAKLLLFTLAAIVLAAALYRLPLDTSRWLSLTIAGAAIASFIPNLVVSSRRAARRKEIQIRLSDTIDMLEICVSSGMGLEMAWHSVAQRISMVSPALADEMALVNLETHLGADNASAMRNMAERTGVHELASLTAVLLQSERFGTSVADALKTFAMSLREERSLRAQEAAEKLVVKLLFPMVLFIFPAVVIVLVGPAFLQLSEALGGGGG